MAFPLRARTVCLAALVTALSLFVLVPGAAAAPLPATAFDFESTYRALPLADHSAPDGWALPDFDDSAWGTYHAPFGEVAICGFPEATAPFPVLGRVLVRKEFTLPAGSQGLHLTGTIDNDVQLYVNGVPVGGTSNGYCQTMGIDVWVPNGLLHTGRNVVAAAADDFGVGSWFDLRATYEVVPVAPAVTPTVDGTLGANGWYTSDVSVSFDVSDPDASTSGCDALTVTEDTAGRTFTCTATNEAGSTTASVTVRRDATSPTLAPVVAPATVLQGGAAAPDAKGFDGVSGVDSTRCEDVATTILGPQAVACTVTDRAGNEASGEASYLVYASPGFGSQFVVGDRSASGEVVFWGSQWAQENSLSGGKAPGAFKGFAPGSGGANCGATFSTSGGNAQPVPGPLPEYMALLVTERVTQSGARLSGTVTHVVVVHTAPGFDGDPGHAGTGTVVATIC